MTTPVISSVGGAISTGQVLTVTGTDMIAEVRTDYDAFFTAQRSGFEGSSPQADGYDTNRSAPELLYDSTVKLRGSKSIRMLMQGVHLWPPGDGVQWGWPVVTANSTWVSGPKDVYIRGYVRWNYYDSVTLAPSWPRFNAASGNTNPFKKLWWAGNPNGAGLGWVNITLNDDGSQPTRWDWDTTRRTGTSELYPLGSFPDGTLKNFKWYCFEIHWVKAGSGGPYIFEAWVDNVLTAGPISCSFGVSPSNTGTIASKVNEWNTNATWIGYEWCDELAVSTSRIRPLSVVEIGDSATYASAHPKYQYPELLSDTSIQVNCDLTGLTGPNYWMWVTDSTGTRSVTAFSLTGAPDTTAPTLTNASAGTPTPVGCTGAHVDTNEANGTLSWANYTSGSTPTDAQVESHTGTGVQGAGSYGSQTVTATGTQIAANVTGLASSTLFDLFFVHRDQAGNLSTKLKASYTTAAADVTAPILSNALFGTLASDGCIGSSVDTNEANGTLYRAVMTALGSCTTPQLIAGTGGNIISGFAWSKAVTATGTQQGTPNIINGLSASTAYRIVFMHQDAAGNNSAQATVDFTTLVAPLQTIFFTENFDDSNFPARGWFDVVTGTLDGAVYSPSGGSSSLKISWSAGMSSPTTPRRHAIPASETVYLRFWVKFGTAVVPWQGSGLPYHPHIFQILTDADSEWIGPAQTNLSVRIETRIFVPCVNCGDALRIYDDPGTTYPHNNASPSLLGTSAAHSVMGGNGRQNASGNYWVDASSLSGFDNDTDFLAAGPVFVNNTWHKVEYYIAMNSVVAGVPQADGIQRYWVDDNIVINQTAMEWRTGQFAAQKFKTVLLVPYIGPPGSPIAQDMWIDNLIVADQQASVGSGVAVASHILRPASTF